MKLSTNTILRIAVVIVVGTITTVLFVSARQSQRVRDTTEAISQTEEILYHLQELELVVGENQAAARGYLITGQPVFVQALSESENQINSELKDIEDRIIDQHAKELLADSIRPFISKRTAYSRNIITTRDQQGQQAASKLIESETGRYYTSEVRRLASKLRSREAELLELRKNKNGRTISQLTITLYIVLALVFFLCMRIIFKVRADVRYIIQKRKREEELRKSEERFRLLVNNVKDYAIYMLDPQGNVESWNSGAERIKGYSASEIIGRSFEIFYTPEDVSKGIPRQHLEVARMKGHFEKQAIRIRKDGSKFWAHVVITALVDDNGNLRGYAKVTRDITTQKNNEEQFQFLNRQLDQSHDAIYVLDAERRIKTWNKGAENLYGFTNDEVLGKDPNSILQTILTSEQIDAALQKLDQSDYWQGEINRKTKSGREISVHSSVSTVRDENGEISGYVSVNLDITEQKKLELRLKQFNKDLEIQVKQKTAELTRTFERITDAFLAFDKNLCYTYANPKAEEMLKLKSGDLIGKGIWDVFPDAVAMKSYKIFNEAMETQQPATVLDYYQPFDIWFEMHIYPSVDGCSVFMRNITEKKQTEQKLQTAHERLLFHVEKAPLGFIEWDRDLQVRSWSKRATEIFGWTEAEVIEHQTSGLSKVFEEYIPRMTVIGRQLIVGDMERNIIQHKGYTKDGKVIWCEWFNSVIRDESGNVITVLSLVQDITERKRAEEDLKKSFVEKRGLAERMSAILNALPANIALLDEKGIIVDVNEAWKTAEFNNGLLSSDYGIGTDYLAVALASKGVKVDDGKYVTNGLLGVLNGTIKEFTFEYPTDTENGRKWFRMIAAPQERQGRTGAVIMHINITEQKEIEKQLRESEQKYKLLFDSNPMPMWMRSLDGRNIIDVNNSACDAYGFSKEEFISLPYTALRHPDEVEAFAREFDQEMSTPTNRGVWKHRRKDNSYIDIEIYAQDIIYSNQKVRLILAKDVTERIKAEEQLRQSYEEVRRLASHLQDIREEERTKMSREIHDQLGQQLTVMKMDISWLHKKMANADKVIKDRMEDLKSIMDDTVKLVRRIASDLRPSLLDDMGLLAAIEWHASEFEKRSGVAIVLSGLKEEPNLSIASRINLFRILQESLTNIGRYARAKNVVIHTDKAKDQFVLDITDDGIGFDMGSLSSKDTLGILGMRERTAMMGGSFDIKSEPGRGTSIHVVVSLESANN